MTNQALTTALLNGPATVKELAALVELSESRVRELLKTFDNLQSDGGRPAKFWLEQGNQEQLVDESQAEESQAEESQAEEQQNAACPFCDAEAYDLTPAGPEGTFLGDSVLLCHKCEKAHNIFSGVEVSLSESRKGRKSRRAPLNPQYKIDAKVAAVEAAGGTLTYDKTTRLWALELPNKPSVLMTSKEFSLFDHVTILEADGSIDDLDEAN